MVHVKKLTVGGVAVALLWNASLVPAGAAPPEPAAAPAVSAQQTARPEICFVFGPWKYCI